MKIKLAIALAAAGVSVSFTTPGAGSYAVFSDRGEGWVRVETANHVAKATHVTARFVPRSGSALYWVWFVADGE